jgi:hypothetical protein
MTAPLLLTLLLLVGTAAVGAAVWFTRRSGLRRRMRRSLVVHTRDGRSFRGVLSAEHADCIVLEQAELLDEKLAIGGEVVLLLSNVSWAQDVTGFARPDAGEKVASERFEVSRDEVK